MDFSQSDLHSASQRLELLLNAAANVARGRTEFLVDVDAFSQSGSSSPAVASLFRLLAHGAAVSLDSARFADWDVGSAREFHAEIRELIASARVWLDSPEGGYEREIQSAVIARSIERAVRDDNKAAALRELAIAVAAVSDASKLESWIMDTRYAYAP